MNISDPKSILKIVFLDNSHIFLPKQHILNLIDEPWFIKNLLEDIPDSSSSEDKIDELVIWEDKLNVLSILETLKTNKLCVREGVSLEYIKYLVDLWCLPKWIEEDIEKLQETKLNNETITKKKYLLDNFTLKCISCHGGFHIFENTKTSCKCHPGHLSPSNGNKWSCCGGEATSKECFIGSHVPIISDYRNVIQFIDTHSNITA
jgi:hypothetical protein